MSHVGTHVIMNVFDIPNNFLLQNLENGIIISNQLVDTLQLNVLDTSAHQFEPFGYTIVYLLSESHLSIHTYPEYHSCYIDIFCCNKNFNPLFAIELVKQLFYTQNVIFHIISR